MSDPTPDRDDERIRAAFHTGRIEPLAPASGHFDEIVARARHRRHRRVAAIAGVFVLAAGAGLGIGALLPGGTDSLTQRHAGNSASRQPTAAPTPTMRRTGTPAPSPRTQPSITPSPGSGPAGLPAGGPVPPGFTTRSVTSVGGGVTYVLGAAPCAHPPCTSMARSTDGGRTWRGVPAPKANLPGQPAGTPAGTVGNVRFASARDGWAYGGALYSTHDGARTWRPIALPVAGVVVDLATDGRTVFALVATCTVPGGSCQGATLLSSPAGSDAWRPVPDVRVSDLGGGIDSSLSLGQQGIARLGSSVFVRSGGGWGRVASMPCTGDARLAGVAAAAAGSDLFGFCGGGGAGQLYLTTYVSTDSGHSWHAAGGASALPAHLVNGTLSVAAASGSVLLVGSGNPDTGGTVQISTDGGASWRVTSLPASVPGWTYVGARSANSLVAISAAGDLYESTDAGRTWVAVRIS